MTAPAALQCSEDVDATLPKCAKSEIRSARYRQHVLSAIVPSSAQNFSVTVPALQQHTLEPPGRCARSCGTSDQINQKIGCWRGALGPRAIEIAEARRRPRTVRR
jgi:hypothetical protein